MASKLNLKKNKLKEKLTKKNQQKEGKKVFN